MKSSVVLLAVLLVTIVLWDGFAVDAHVMGIDFGSEFIKVAGPHSDQSVDIVLNELSKRKTDNYLGFRNGERYIGDQAKTLAARFPLLTVAAVNQLMGMQQESPEVAAFTDMKYEYNIQFDTRHTATVPVKDPHGPFTAEELYSMFLNYAQQISFHDGVVNPKSAVVTVPFHASIAERRAILEAARLARIDVLGFLHSTTAAAMYYGIRRRGFDSRNVTLVVFDVGTTHTEAGVYRFTPPEKKHGTTLGDGFGTITTIAVLEDKTLGGRALDLCVARIIEKDAMDAMGIPPVLGGRSPAQLKSQFSLLRAANKAREVLSANSKTPLSVEGITPDRDFHSMISRETFEKECSPFFERVKALASKILTETGLKPSAVDAFELMGGAARTPRIIADISSLLGREVDRTLNMDEAAAIGAAYYAVKLSPLYRVKSFKLNEKVPFSISFTVNPPVKTAKNPTGTPLKRSLFTTNDNLGSFVSVSLNRTQDFSLELYDDATTPTQFATLSVTGVEEALSKLRYLEPELSHPNNSHFVRIQLRVNETGLLDPEYAEVHVRYAVNVSRLVHVNETGEDGKVSTTTEKEYVVKMRQKSRRLPVHVVWSNPRERTEDEWLNSETKLFDILEHEQRKRESAEAKNNFEGFLFWIKGDGVFYNDELLAKTDSNKLQALRDAVEQAELWLEEGYGSSDACTRAEYEEAHAALKKLLRDALGAPDTDATEAHDPAAAASNNGESEDTTSFTASNAPPESPEEEFTHNDPSEDRVDDEVPDTTEDEGIEDL